MGPLPLPHHLPNLLLQYFLQADRIPIHLLSKQLLQRHHFLHITPEQQLSYLRWPASDVEQDAREENQLTHFLNDLAFVNVDSLDDFPVRYTSDDEDTYAHVHVHLVSAISVSDIRLVFLWDEAEEGSWRFHDIKSMPFPSSSSASLPSSSIQNSDQLVRREHTVLDDTNDSDDDDSYWNSYGAQDDDAEDQVGQSYGVDAYEDGEKAEDAYWAQYAKVQGTADSTIPSPLPLRNKQQTTHHASTSSDFRAHSPFSRTLTDRLANLSPPHSPMFSPFFEKPQATEQDASPDLSSSSSATVDSVSLQLQTLSVPSDVLISSTKDEPLPRTLQIPGDDDNLRATIRGLYRMWANIPDNDLDSRIRTKENFMHIVMDSLVDM